jgi:hypothetical protein
VFLRCFYRLAASLVVVTGCQDKASKVSPPVAPADVIVRDAGGAVVAELKVTRPCRATIGPLELIVGGPPLVATVGSTQWTGQTEPNGTLLIRDGERIARIFPVGDATAGAVFDLKGVAQARIEVTGETAVVKNAATVPVRRLTLASGTITADDPALTITGTDDLVLAALLSAPEVLPEIRMLAACERVLVKGMK